MAVTKTVPAARMRELADLGVTLVGENRVQEAREKQQELAQVPFTWHLIGHLQSNKVKKAVGSFQLIQSVDSVELLDAIDREARRRGTRQDVLLQVNVAREATKFGFAPEEVDPAVEAAKGMEGARLQGLMTVAPAVDDPEEVRWVFRELRRLRDRLEARFQISLPELSMGMSLDFGVAIGEGATLIRIGTGLFGVRPDGNRER